MGNENIAALQRLLKMAPPSSMPAYDDEAADNPDYQAWSAVRPSAPPALDYHGSAAEARDSVDSSRLTALETPDQRQEFAEGGDPMVAILRKKLGLGPGDRSSKQALENTQHTLEDDALTEQNKADARKRSLKAQDLTDELQTYGRPDVTSMRKDKQQSAIDLATAGDKVKGGFGLQEQTLKNAGDLAVAKVAHPDPLAGGAGGSGSGADYVTFVAEQIQRDRGNATLFPKPVVAQAMHQLAQAGGDIKNVSLQTRQMGEMADALLPEVDKLRAQAQDLADAGVFRPVFGSARKMLAERGLGTMVGFSPEQTQKMTKFESSLAFFKLTVQKALEGAKGAASPGMAARFDKIINDTGDLSSFKGNLDAAENELGMYSSTRRPTSAGAAPPTSGGRPVADVDVDGIIRH